MINNWDIISRLDSATQSLLYTLVIDGTEHDARLIAKKLKGYVQPPQPAVAPFVYAFELPKDLDEDTLEKIRTATREGIEQTNKVNQFVPGGILGEPLFNAEVTQEDKDFPSFITLDPSESFFKASDTPKQVSLQPEDDEKPDETKPHALEKPVLDITAPTAEVFQTPTIDTTSAPNIVSESLRVAIPDTTSPQETSQPEQTHGSQTTETQKTADIPEDFIPDTTSPQRTSGKTGKFFADKTAPQAIVPPEQTGPQATETQKPADGASTELPPIDQNDMLIKDMEDSLLNKMPVEDIFAAETKYDMFLDSEDLANLQAQAKQDEVPAPASETAPRLEDTFNVFEQKIKDQTSIIDLEELTAITERISNKDLEFVNHANTSPAVAAEIAAAAQEKEKTDRLNNPPAGGSTGQAFSPAKTISDADLPELPVVRPIHNIAANEPSQGELMEKKNQPDFPEEINLENSTSPNAAQKPSSGPQQPAQNLPKLPENENEEVLEQTFNLTTTLNADQMRAQYEKSFHNTQDPQPAPTIRLKKRPLPSTPQTPTPRPPQTPQTPASNTFLLRRKTTPSPVPPTPQTPAPAPTPSVLRHKTPAPAPIPTPKAPASMPQVSMQGIPNSVPTPMPQVQAPHVSAPAPAPAPTPAPQAAAKNTAPVTSAAQPAPKPATAQAKASSSANQTVPEKTTTIDHSIELPLSELKKHNWPLEVPLLPTYTMENMVMSVNRFAHATAISVVENPGKLYNPLVLHGPTGTGKTHFLNAMAYAFSKKFGQENIFMTNGVRLSRGIQRYAMEGNMEKFEKFMDTVKVLLIDDIHLLAINEQNRKQISNLLNKFLREQKQILITSKYPPESLAKLEELIRFRLGSGWITELKPAGGSAHLKIVKKMLFDNGVDLTDAQINEFFGESRMTLSTIMRSIHRLKVLENLIFPNLDKAKRSQAVIFEKLLATKTEDPESELLQLSPEDITSITPVGNGEWGRIGFFYPQNCANMMHWMVYALQQRAKELQIPGGFEIAVRSSYATENIISSAFKIANLCDNKKLKGAVILGPTIKTCDPSVRENFYDILTHMLEIMLIRCGIINMESVQLPSTYVKVISELLR